MADVDGDGVGVAGGGMDLPEPDGDDSGSADGDGGGREPDRSSLWVLRPDLEVNSTLEGPENTNFLVHQKSLLIGAWGSFI